MTNGKVTLRDIYEVVNRLEEKQDERLEKLENRVDTLENFRDRLLGIATVVGLFTGVVATWIWKKISQ